MLLNYQFARIYWYPIAFLPYSNEYIPSSYFQVFILTLVNMLYLFQVHPHAATLVHPVPAHSSGSGVSSHQPATGSDHPKPRQVPQVGLIPCLGLATYPMKFELFLKLFLKFY